MAGFGALITIEYDVPHFSVSVDYKVVVDFTNPDNGLIRLEDMDHAFKHALFSHYHDYIRWWSLKDLFKKNESGFDNNIN